jgi:glycosyltransferase involved in cell wall biosynthesis
MKILTLNHNLRQIGTYGRCFYFSRELARHGHDVTMVTVSPDEKFRERAYYVREYQSEYAAPHGDGPWVRMVEGPGLGYRWLPGWGSGPLDIGGRLRRILTEGYDVVYGFEYQPNVSWPVYLTRLLKPYRFYSDWCDWYAGSANTMGGRKWAQRIDAFWEERIRLRADAVTVTSRALHERARAIGVSEERIVDMPQGIDTEYCLPYDKAEMRARFGLPADRPILLAVREDDTMRETRVAAEVAMRLPDVLVVFVGRIPERTKQLARELGLERNVHYAGWVSDDDYPRILSTADLCYLPKDPAQANSRANWTGKFLDYLACGVPAAVNDIGEEGALLRAHSSQPIGVLTGHGFDEFAESVAHALRDRAALRAMGARARKVMVEGWDWRVRGAQIAAVVQRR